MSTPLTRFDKIAILVVGDVMLDLYHHGDTQRISPEAPVPVVKISWVEKCAGGGANVAINLATLGVKTHLLGMTGSGRNGDCLEQILSEHGVRHHLIKADKHPTIVKSRVMSQGRQLLRFDTEENFATLPSASKAALNKSYGELIQQVDAVIFSDYAKGCLAEITTLINVARRHKKTIFVDPKGSDYEHYRGATILTPNYKEFIAVVGECRERDEMYEKAEHLRDSLDLHALFVTLAKMAC